MSQKPLLVRVEYPDGTHSQVTIAHPTAAHYQVGKAIQSMASALLWVDRQYVVPGIVAFEQARWNRAEGDTKEGAA